MIVGSIVIYLAGATWLSGFIGGEKAIAVGVMPFVFGDLVKAGLAALVFPAIWTLTGRK